MTRWRIKLDTDTAALELLLAQMAQEYRKKFRLGFPTEGDPDVQKLYYILDDAMETKKNDFDRALDHIIRLWLIYLRDHGAEGSVSGFRDWLLWYESGGNVVSFRRAKSS